ncbi:MAG: phenylalanine--tRNA ligase subunit alpha, partial [Clostridia bacterium]|nr:phenylalanine--tRNA ligase subunit alpha [Clostridia bacterium]
MQEKINELKKKIADAIKDVKSSDTLFQIKMKFLGKSGEVSELMKGLRDVPKEKRPELGMIINALKAWAEDQFGRLDKSIKASELKKLYAAEAVDVTLPGNISKKGAYHPNTLVRRELISVFAGMGFTVFEGPEIETDYYNFTALNTPADHPARDMQDTFYITDNLLLRTQTSAGQIRVMEKQKPPIKILSPGKVYRSDDDATHSPMFSQMEGLVVDKGITLCDLKGMLDEFARKIFGENIK